jgi:hypothetical protein
MWKYTNRRRVDLPTPPDRPAALDQEVEQLIVRLPRENLR